MKIALRILLGLLFLTTGTVHLLNPELLLPIMPPWVPFPLFCIKLSGVAEIVGGVSAFFPPSLLRKLAGWGLVMLLIAVFPANVHMAMAQITLQGFPPQPWENWARLPLQPVLIYLVIYSFDLLKPNRRQSRFSPLTLSTR